MNRRSLAIQAVRAATRLRLSQKVAPAHGVCPFDIGRKLGISIRLASIPSLEGMYSPEPSLAIVIGSERPLGRKRYTCGHELGHHVFGHGYRMDELDEFNSTPHSPEEFIAQRFSAALLMPKIATDATFAKRGWDIPTATPEQIFMVAQELGVGYTALITNLSANTNQLTQPQADRLKKSRLPALRNQVAGFNVDGDVFFLSGPCARPILDVEVGDIIILPDGAKLESNLIEKRTDPSGHFVALTPGTAEISFPGGERNSLRISRRNFIGLAHYRYLEEENE